LNLGHVIGCRHRRCMHGVRNMNVVKIHLVFSAVYGQHIRSEGNVRQCCRCSEVLIKKIVKYSVPPFQNVHLNFHNFHALCCTRLSQLGYAVSNSVQDEFQKCSQLHTNLREWLWLWIFIGAIPQWWWFISQLHPWITANQFLWILRPKSSHSSGSTHIHQISRKFKLIFACMEVDGNCFLEQERSVIV
jgi:hypothetical protein